MVFGEKPKGESHKLGRWRRPFRGCGHHKHFPLQLSQCPHVLQQLQEMMQESSSDSCRLNFWKSAPKLENLELDSP